MIENTEIILTKSDIKRLIVEKYFVDEDDVKLEVSTGDPQYPEMHVYASFPKQITEYPPDWPYDPERDADESQSHLCNSLNAMSGVLRSYEGFRHFADYALRAEHVIMYLKRKLKE